MISNDVSFFLNEEGEFFFSENVFSLNEWVKRTTVRGGLKLQLYLALYFHQGQNGGKVRECWKVMTATTTVVFLVGNLWGVRPSS